MHISSSLSELCHLVSHWFSGTRTLLPVFWDQQKGLSGFLSSRKPEKENYNKYRTNFLQICSPWINPVRSGDHSPLVSQADCFFKIFMADSNGKEVPVSPVNGSSATTITHSMAGHLGNLTPQQEQAFNKFIENLTKANLYTPGSDNHEASHDDATLLCAILLNTQCC